MFVSKVSGWILLEEREETLEKGGVGVGGWGWMGELV